MKLNTVMTKRSDRLAGLIAGGMTRKHLNNERASAKAGLSERTFIRRRKDPMTLSVYELFRLADALGFVVEIKEKEDVC